MQDIIIVCGGGHAASVADSLERAGEYRIIGYTDLHPGSLPYPYLGTDDTLAQYYAQGVRYAAMGLGQLGDASARRRLTAYLTELGYTLPAVIDPSAAVSPTAVLGAGVFVGKGAAVNAGASVETMAIINTHAVVEHDCTVGAFAHLAVSAVLCGGVTVGEDAFIGANATVLQTLTVGARALVGAGTLVCRTVPADTLVRQQLVTHTEERL